MTIAITGIVANGVVVPNAPLPDGAEVEIYMKPSPPDVSPVVAAGLTTSELRRMPRELRQAVLAAAAEMAEQDYRVDKELTGFDAYREEELDDDDIANAIAICVGAP